MFKILTMETNLKAAQEILNRFLDVWKDDALREMTLEQYVAVNDPYTFCQWVEHRTDGLGSIQKDSFKFGIYKRRTGVPIQEDYPFDSAYSWRKLNGIALPTRDAAFGAVHAELLHIIEAAQRGQFERIDEKGMLLGVFKWKVAFLFSNERLVPIYSSVILEKLAPHFGLPKRASVSAIQASMMVRKPAWMSVYEYADNLLKRYRAGLPLMNWTNSSDSKEYRIRKPIDTKNTNDTARKGTAPTIVTRWHNKLQLQLEKELKGEFPEGTVLLEDNYVDIKVEIGDDLYLYEVKSVGSASDCITAAMGQIMRYAYRHDVGFERIIKLVIAGQQPLLENDEKYLAYVNQMLQIPIEYRRVILPDEG